MRFSTRSKVGGLLSLLAIVTIITAFMLSGLVFRGTATHASNAQYSATPGTLTPAGTDNLRNGPTTIAHLSPGFFPRGPIPFYPVKTHDAIGVKPQNSEPIFVTETILILNFTYTH